MREYPRTICRRDSLGLSMRSSVTEAGTKVSGNLREAPDIQPVVLPMAQKYDRLNEAVR